MCRSYFIILFVPGHKAGYTLAERRGRGKLLLAAGRVAPWLRRGLLAFYIVFLVLIIVTVVPISALVKTALAPWLRNSIARQKQYFSQPSGE